MIPHVQKEDSPTQETKEEVGGKDRGGKKVDGRSQEARGTKRIYQPIWEEVLRRVGDNNFAPVKVRIPELSDEVFVRIRKAFWKERDLAAEEIKKRWRAKVVRDKDDPNIIHFSVIERIEGMI